MIRMEAKEQIAVETSHQRTADRKGNSVDLPKMKTKSDSRKRESGNLKKTIAALKKENAEFKEKHLRLAAEFENYRKMMTRELENRARNTRENLILEFLAVVDDLDRTMSAISKKRKKDPIADGVQLIHSQVKSLLQRHGVEEIGTVGNEFDVGIHEALMMVENASFASNVVVEVHQKGYKLNGRVLRHAKVAVNK
jgi:molecular chaperone GrpE